VPRWAHHEDRRGPFAALLILIGLLFSAGSVSAGGIVGRDASARLGPLRQGSATSLVHAADGATLAAEDSGTDAPSFLRPPRPRIVVERLASRPAQPRAVAASPARPASPAAPYRARAPPAA
jgi:hypothetical protein